MAKNPSTRLSSFVWEGIDRRGRKVKGEHEAPSVAFLNATLRRQGIRTTKVRKKQSSLFSRSKKIKPRDIAIASRQMATMIAAGIPIAGSIEAIGRGHENANMQKLLTTIRQDVESGTAFSVALGKHPMHFDRLYTSLVEAGEQSGKLDMILDKIAGYLEKIEAIKSKIKSAMFYPAAIVLVAIVVIALMLLFVIPQFESLFTNFGAELPTLTQVVVDLSRWMQNYWWLFFGILFGSIILIGFLYRRSTRMQYAVDRVILKLPIIGPILKKAVIARFTRTLATMFGAGVPLVDSLDAVANATGNRVYQNGTIQIKNEVSTGRSLEGSMNQTGLFPNMVLQMVSTGEESGELEMMLNKVADFFEREVDDAVAALSSLFEPVMIVFLGIVVGVIVVAMYLPIFKIAAVF